MIICTFSCGDDVVLREHGLQGFKLPNSDTAYYCCCRFSWINDTLSR